MKVLRALALGLGLLLATSAQSSNELVTGSAMASLISGGTFVNSGSCSFSGDLIVTRASFVSCIQNNGSCAGSGDYVMTYGDMTSCAVSYTLENMTESSTLAINGHPGTYTGGTTVSISNASFPVSYSGTVTTNNTGIHCAISVVIGGTTVYTTSLAGTSQSFSGSYTGGLTGTIKYNVGVTSGSGAYCDAAPSVTVSWYH